MKKVLIVTYYWPPSGGGGVQRWLKFVKYFPQFGIEPIVVTVKEDKASYPFYDPELEKEVPAGVRVIRTNSFEPLRLFSALVKKENVPYAGIPDRSHMSLLGKISLFIRANYFIPDARKGWNKYAYRECCRIIEKEKIDYVLTTSPPHSTQLIGLQLKKKYSIKWLADLRDPWTDIYYYKKLHHSERALKKDKQYEMDVLMNADRIAVTSKHTKQLFISKTQANISEKIKVITNGYDPADFSGVNDKKEKEFTITFTGTINRQFGISGFLQALKKITEKNDKINLRLRFVGSVDEQVRQEARSALKEKVSFVDYVPHQASIHYCCTSHLLLLVIPHGDNLGTVPGKLFEYMATQNPVLCLSPDNGSASEMIREAKAGQAFTHEDLRGIEEFILDQYGKWERGENILINNANFKMFSRENITRSLTDILFPEP